MGAFCALVSSIQASMALADLAPNPTAKVVMGATFLPSDKDYVRTATGEVLNQLLMKQENLDSMQVAVQRFH